MSPDIHLNEQPLGRMLSLLGKSYLSLLRIRLQHLDIDRYYYALVLIGRQDGIITQQELALLLDSDKVSIVRIIDYLSGKGYVKRMPKPDDRRKHSLLLTEKGKRAIPEIEKSFSDLNEFVLNGLEKKQITELNLTISKIKQNLIHNTEPK